MALGFGSVMLAHVLLILVFITFKQFHRGKKMINRFNRDQNCRIFSPKLIIFGMVVFIVFIFTWTYGVRSNQNSYSIPYKGPETTTMERIERFFIRK